MTHDELLEKLNDKYIVFNEPDSVFNFYKKQSNALRAVVELHRPTTIFLTDNIEENYCGTCGDTVWVPYPCQTIQTIQKELM